MEKAMAIANPVDYSYPMLMAQKALKDAHEAVLKKDFDGAVEEVMTALAETKLTLNAIKELRELYK